MRHLLLFFYLRRVLKKMSMRQKLICIFFISVLNLSLISLTPSTSPKSKPEIQRGKEKFGLLAVLRILWAAPSNPPKLF